LSREQGREVAAEEAGGSGDDRSHGLTHSRGDAGRTNESGRLAAAAPLERACVSHPGIAFGPPRRVGRPTISEIVDGLLVGAYLLPDDFSWLRDEHRVTAIVCLQDDADLAARGLEAAALAAAGAAAATRWHHLPVPDADVEALGLRLAAIARLVDELLRAGDRVYLHCSAGFNRAPTAAIAYLHAHAGLALDAATALVESRRSCQPYPESLRLFAASLGR
jgi:protein-tyrosine phosphatase